MLTNRGRDSFTGVSSDIYQVLVRLGGLRAAHSRFAMGDMKRQDLSSMLAAAIIMAMCFELISVLPTVVLWLGAFSPWLGFASGALIIGSFFLVFWGRSMWQRRNGRR